MLNPDQVLLSQYQGKPIFEAVLANWNANIDPRKNLTLYYNTVWNVLTASGYGLDVLGRIVGVGRSLLAEDALVFGFSEGVDWLPFNDGVFATGNGLVVDTLSDAAYRTLILMKARANISNCSAYDINSILYSLFGASGPSYIIDTGGMTATARFKFTPTTDQTAIITQSNVIPRPAGVALTITTEP